MWQFFGVLCLLLLPHVIDAADKPMIRSCPANKVCVNFVEDKCANEVGGVKGSDIVQARLWTEDYMQLCSKSHIDSIIALLDIEVLNPNTWSIEVAVWEYIYNAKFEFAKSKLEFSGTKDAATAKFSWGSESASFVMKNEPLIRKTDFGARLGTSFDVYRYSFELTANGQPLVDIIGGSVAYKGDDSDYKNIPLTDPRFAKLIKEKTAAVTPTTPPPTEEQKGPHIGLLIGGIAGGLLLGAGVAYGVYILRRNRQRKRVIKQWSDHLKTRTCESGGSILQQFAETPKQGSDRKEILDNCMESVSAVAPSEEKFEEVSAAAAGAASFEGVSMTGQRGDGPTESREPTASRERTPTQRESPSITGPETKRE